MTRIKRLPVETHFPSIRIHLSLSTPFFHDRVAMEERKEGRKEGREGGRAFIRNRTVRISRWLTGEPPLGWAAHTYFHDIRGKRSGYSTRAGRQPMIVVRSEIGQCDDEGRWIGQPTPF